MNFDCSGPPCLPKKAAGKYPSGQAFCVDVDCVTTPIIAVETYDNTGALVASGYELANANGQPNGTPYTGPVKKVPCDPQRVKFVDSCVPLQVTTGPQPVAPVNGQDCAGAPVAVPKALVETRRVVQEPGTVFTVKLCPDPTSGVELATACNALGDKILLQYDTKTVPPTELSRTNTRTGAAEPAGTLVKCDQDDDAIETAPLSACLNGAKIPGIAVLTDASAGMPTVIGELWRDPVTGLYGALPAGAVVGDCVQPPQVRYDNEDQLEPGCADGVPSTRVTKVIYDDLTGEQVGVPAVVYRDSAGVETATQPANWNLGACPPVVSDRKVLIYLERNGSIVNMTDIITAAGTDKIQSVTVKQISGNGSVTADAGSGVPLSTGETWSWSAITGSDYWDHFGGSALAMDAGSGEQRITATYIP